LSVADAGGFPPGASFAVCVEAFGPSAGEPSSDCDLDLDGSF
jgi:hypothetical protein